MRARLAFFVALLGCGSNVTVQSGSGSGGAGSGAQASVTAVTTGSGPGSGVTSGQGPGTGPTTVVTSSGAGGSPDLPPPSEECWGCVEMVVGGPCEPFLAQCENDLACNVLVNCYEQCGWTGSCVKQCNSIVPSGVAPVSAILDCAACDHCFDVCAGSSMMLFCM
jgi:hypothetical protein